MDFSDLLVGLAAETFGGSDVAHFVLAAALLAAALTRDVWTALR